MFMQAALVVIIMVAPRTWVVVTSLKYKFT